MTLQCRTIVPTGPAPAAGVAIPGAGAGLPPPRRVHLRGETIGAATGGAPLVVRSGLAATAIRLADGRRRLVCLHGPGDMLDPAPGAGTAGRREWSEALDRCEVEEVAFDGPGAAGPLRLAALARDRARRLAARAALMAIRSDGARILAFLGALGWQGGCAGGGRCCLPLAPGDIADYLGLGLVAVEVELARAALPVSVHAPDA